MAEVESELQRLHETKDVTARVAGRVLRSSSVMADDQNLALAAAIFEAELRALL
jgi:hypothetical protein